MIHSLFLLKFYRKDQPWIWRCHINISNPYPELWKFLKRFILRYDKVVISTENYRKEDLPVEQKSHISSYRSSIFKEQRIIKKRISKTLRNFGIRKDKPLITQISRFDKWKDPLGILDAEIYGKVRDEVSYRILRRSKTLILVFIN
ncbi:MAG: hypothetical protein ACFFBD_15110 [Candidatus Hodarchaeota archaeon]